LTGHNGFDLDQLCPKQMSHCAKKYVTVWTRAAHWMTC